MIFVPVESSRVTVGEHLADFLCAVESGCILPGDIFPDLLCEGVMELSLMAILWGLPLRPLFSRGALRGFLGSPSPSSLAARAASFSTWFLYQRSFSSILDRENSPSAFLLALLG